MTTLVEEITKRFEEDIRTAEPVHSRNDVPTTYELITPEWFSDVLCRDYPGTFVTKVALGPADNGSANRRRVFLEYNKQGVTNSLPATVFCKAAQSLPNRVMLGGQGCLHGETAFYNLVAPTLRFPVPHCYHAVYDGYKYNYIIVLEDMTDAEFCKMSTKIDKRRAVDQVRVLASLHGKSYDRKDLQDALKLPTFPQFWQGVIANKLEEFSNKGFLEAEAVIPSRLYRKYEQIWPAAQQAVDIYEHSVPALMHGDCHVKNWYVDPNGRMGMTDWQTTAFGFWGRDLAYTISTSLEVEDRRDWERELIAEYLDHLRENGGPKVSFDEGWNAYRQQLMCVLPYWTVTLTPSPDQPDMQPRDDTLEIIRRIAYAIDDLDAVESL